MCKVAKIFSFIIYIFARTGYFTVNFCDTHFVFKIVWATKVAPTLTKANLKVRTTLKARFFATLRMTSSGISCNMTAIKNRRPHADKSATSFSLKNLLRRLGQLNIWMFRKHRRLINLPIYRKYCCLNLIFFREFLRCSFCSFIISRDKPCDYNTSRVSLCGYNIGRPRVCNYNFADESATTKRGDLATTSELKSSHYI